MSEQVRIGASRESPGHRISTIAEVEATVGRPAPMIRLKQLGALDDGCRTLIERSPIAGFGFRSADGVPHSTFVGGAPGFVRIDSPRRFRFEVPDEVEALSAAHGVSFVFLLPGIGETLRVNGAVADRNGAELVVEVHEAYVHCARCVLRSRLWSPPPPAGAPRSRAVPDGEGPLRRRDVAEFLRTTSFFVVSTHDATGGGDTSPRGDNAGFVRVLDGATIAIPDRAGNQRADTFHNLVADDRISLVALVPGRDDVLHLHGRGWVSTEPELLASMSLRGTTPQAALIIDVVDAQVGANSAVTNAAPWSPASHVDRAAVPDMMALASQQAAAHSGESRDGPPRFLLTLLGNHPRLTRFVMDIGYRTQLRKEGYQDGAAIGSGVLGRLRAVVAALRGHDLRGAATSGSRREMRVTEVRRETADAVTVVLEDPAGDGAPPVFRPGQFFTVVADIGGERVRRAYSASSASGRGRLEVTIKQVPGGRFSGHVHSAVAPGDRWEILGPSGTLLVDPKADEQIVMIAAGSGITPMMSVIRTLLDADSTSRLDLLYGNRGEEDIIFRAELERLRRDHPSRLAVTHRLSRPGSTWTGDRGRLEPAVIRQWVEALAPSPRARYLLCGPEPVMRAARGVLRTIGVPDAQVHEESYTSAAAALDLPDSGPHGLLVEEDGRRVGTTVVEPGATLLEAGMAAGLPMPYSCTVGNCGECMVGLRTGEVVSGEPNCLTAEQRRAGFVLTCVSRPTTDVTLDISEDGLPT